MPRGQYIGNKFPCNIDWELFSNISILREKYPQILEKKKSYSRFKHSEVNFTFKSVRFAHNESWIKHGPKRYKKQCRNKNHQT